MMSGSVLYIEDNEDNRTLVKRVIQSMGLVVEEAPNGLDGIWKARELKPDVVLLDINLPDISGFEVARRMRSSGDPHLLYVPIIAVTANALRGDAEKVLEAGCDVYMSKPINIRELMARIAAFMEVIQGPAWSKEGEWNQEDW
jgi:two-component system, cell cycle response regulator DivK